MVAIIIHGWWGINSLTQEQQKLYKKSVSTILIRCYEQLTSWADAETVATNAAVYMEDDPIYNAGKWSVLTNSEQIEMDAAIMHWKNLSCGAIAWVSKIKNPVLLAQKVMQFSEHCFLIGSGAEEFAKIHDLEIKPYDYFVTDRRKNQLLKAKEWNIVWLDHEDKKFGTIWVVVFDKNKDIVTVTSTGGLVNKKYWRVGDSPIIGAWTYANNETCWISCTWYGEAFLRLSVAKDISDRIKYQKISMYDAMIENINDLKKLPNWKWWIIWIDKNWICISAMTDPWMICWCMKTWLKEPLIDFFHPIKI